MEPNASARVPSRGSGMTAYGVNGLTTPSASMLMDPKAMKKQMTNGTTLPSHCKLPDPPSRPTSETFSTQALRPDDCL